MNIRAFTIISLAFILITIGILQGDAQGVISRPKNKTKQTTIKNNKTTHLIPIHSMHRQNSTSPEKTSRNQTTKISEPDNYINGYGYVDLGLPSGIKWATCNVGSTHPQEFGEYYAWGETKTKSDYSPLNSLTYRKSQSSLQTEKIINSNNILTKPHDIANIQWGSPWRIPTKADFEELRYNAEWE